MARIKKAQFGYRVAGQGRSCGIERQARKDERQAEKDWRKMDKQATREMKREERRAPKMQDGGKAKKIKLREDSRDYITKVKTDDKGNIVSLKSRRTLKGLASGAPSAKKIMKNGGKTPAWQRKEGKNPSGGLNAKGVASYRAANPGSKLKTAVTTKPSKLKPGSKAANRRKSFCARMSGMKKRLTSAKTANDPNSRINKSLRKWNC